MLALCSFRSSVTSVSAQSGVNVLVVTNAADADSIRIGDYYASHRGVPAIQVLALQRLPVKPPDAIERVAFEAAIQLPIANWLSANDAQDRIHYIVLTKGIPLRISGSSGRTGTVASVDSELSALYQRMTEAQVPLPGAFPNPYFLGDQPVTEAMPFSHERIPLYLVTRLDGYTVDDVLKLIDHGNSPVTEGRVVLHQRASWLALGNAWLKAAADRLRDAGLGDRVLLEATGKVVTNEPSVIGYYSWGSNDPAITERNLGIGFVPGALAAQFVSYDGRTFHEPPPPGAWARGRSARHISKAPQSPAGDLVRGSTQAWRRMWPSVSRRPSGRGSCSRLLSGHECRVVPRHAQRELADVIISDPLCALQERRHPRPRSIRVSIGHEPAEVVLRETGANLRAG
jgi:uncharacterized protein (TIGR03790 family)